MPIKNLRCNEQIRISPVRLIDERGVQAGVVETAEALRRARDAGLDLVEVSPNERPPVCKIMDYGKFKYSQSKQKQKHHEQKLKEIRLRPKTDPHDRAIKVDHARRFLEHGDRVQFTMLFKGRERFHQDMGKEVFDAILRDLGELARIERPAAMDGRRMTMLLVSSKTAPPKKPGKAASAQKPRKPAAEPGATPATAAGSPTAVASPKTHSPPVGASVAGGDAAPPVAAD